MHQYSFAVFPKREDQPVIRFFGPDENLIDQRELDKAEIDAFVERVESGYRTGGPHLASLGRRLYDWLDGPTQRWMEQAREGNEGFTIRVDVGQRLRHLPWELLCADGVCLCSNPLRPFTPVRRVGENRCEVPQANRPLRILMMACSPLNVEPVLDFEKEERLILDAAQNQPVELVMEESGSLEGLSFRVSSRAAGYYDVLHLSGHATIKNGQPIFMMETDVGELFEARADQIAGAFQGRWPRLVFLSGCKTGQAPEEGTLPSLCEVMVEAGAPAVLGWALPVGDKDASIAVAELCRCLATGHRIDEAVARARQKLHAEESKCWHLLRLYADATPLTELVTPLETAGRERLHARQAQEEFLDAGAKMEVCPRELFVGRRRLIQRCLRVLRSRPGTPGHREGVLLIGMGGLGKSSLAARLCERMPGHKRVICVGNVDELAFMRALADQLEDAEAIKVLNAPDLPLEHRLRQLLKDHLDSSPALFVFDDFEHSLEDSQEGDAKVVKAAALEVLTSLLAAVRKTASDSRVLVTCRYDFPLPGPAGLHPESLESMRGAELRKKIDLLEHLKPEAVTDAELKHRATELASGNPRLLEWLDLVLADEQTDHEAVLSALGRTAEEFREEVLLLELLGQLADDGRRLVALLSVCGLPVDRAAVEVIAGDVPVDPHLARASAVGLIEAGIEPGTTDQRYYVSGILDPMLATLLSDDEQTEARRRAARHLHKVWWVDAAGRLLERGLEIQRLAMLAAEQETAADVGDTVATVWFDQARYREAEALCRVTLHLGDDYRILHSLARAEEVLGKTDEARRHYEQALALCPAASPDAEKEVLRERSAIVHNLAGLLLQQGEVAKAMGLWEESLKLAEQIGDVRGKAATLNNMAGVLAQRGEVAKAMGLWEESLKLKEQIGEVGGRASTLHEMAGVLAEQGEVAKAMGLWEESLKLKQQIGDVRGKAATLANMAWAAHRQGNRAKAQELNLEAAQALAAVRAWPDLVRVLGNLGASGGEDEARFLAQAFWLVLRVSVPMEGAVSLAAALLTKVGVASETGPLVATAGNFLVETRGKDHPKHEEFRKAGVAMLGACAEERKVPPGKFMEWIQSEGLNDPERFLPALDRALAEMVAEDGWLFDRALVTGGEGPSAPA